MSAAKQQESGRYAVSSRQIVSTMYKKKKKIDAYTLVSTLFLQLGLNWKPQQPP